MLIVGQRTRWRYHDTQYQWVKFALYKMCSNIIRRYGDRKWIWKTKKENGNGNNMDRSDIRNRFNRIDFHSFGGVEINGIANLNAFNTKLDWIFKSNEKRSKYYEIHRLKLWKVKRKNERKFFLVFFGEVHCYPLN